MKKYIITGMLVLGFLIPAYSFAQSTQTLPSDIDPLENDSSCVSLVNNLRYRSRDINTNGEVSTLQDYLQSKGFLNSEPTGYFGLLTVKAVKSFQREYKINSTGYVGPVTRAKIKVLTCGDIEPSSAVVISAVSGPQTLNVNQTGTWTVNASSTTGGNLSYSVRWGDEVMLTTQGVNEPNRPAPQQSATFTHAYSKVGIYKPTFTVTSANTINCITTPCPGNGGSAQASLSVNVGGVIPTGSVTVVSPNGGETWKTGTIYEYIKWKDNNTERCSTSTGCIYDITLQPYYPPCTSNICPLSSSYPYHSPYTIAKNVSGYSFNYSFNWQVGHLLDASIVPAGAYLVQICQTGTTVCDSSDSYFKITNEGGPTTSGTLYVQPDSTTVKVGGTTELKAMYQPPEPACRFSNPPCMIATPAPYAVEATWTSSDVKVATVEYKDTCPSGAYCFAQQLDKKIAVITGVKEGTATITGVFKDSSGATLKAVSQVTVTTEPIAMCDYPAPPNWCTYVPGPEYNSNTGCGMVLTCNGTTNNVLGAESFNFTQLLKLGSTGSEVTELQKFLTKAMHYTGAFDGNFGTKTETAVKKFQTANGLTADGIVGSMVRAILNK